MLDPSSPRGQGANAIGLLREERAVGVVYRKLRPRQGRDPGPGGSGQSRPGPRHADVGQRVQLLDGVSQL